MLVKIEARILIFPGTDFHFPSTSVPPGTFLRLCTYVQHTPNIPQHYLAKYRTHSSDGSCIVSLKTVVMKSNGCCKF